MVNLLVASEIARIRREYLELLDPDSTGKIWHRIDEMEDNIVITMVIPSRGCSWALSEAGGCSVCGYVNDSSRDKEIPKQKILRVLNEVLHQIPQKKYVELKIFNSGSFFDNKDLPKEFREELLKVITVSEKISKLTVECRPEFVIQNLNDIKAACKLIKQIKMEIGLGLESSNNSILVNCWNKGTTLEEYTESVKILQSLNIRIKTYVFVKPPFLSEAEAIEDTLTTIQQATASGTDVVSVNPCVVQNGTLVSFLYKNDKYQPPWLWSVLEVIKKTRENFPELELICDPTAGGKPRGAHNCGKCDKEVLNRIKKIVQGEKMTEFDINICSCYKTWKFLVESPVEMIRIRNLSKLRKLNPLME